MADSLSQITSADGSVRRFVYEFVKPSVLALTGVVDERGLRYSTFGYDAQGRAISTEHAGGVGRYSVAYISAPTVQMTEMYNATADVLHRIYSWVPPQAPVITFPTGASSTMTVATAATQPHIASRSQPAGSGCGASTSAATYDANGNPASADDFNGNRTCHAYDPSRNLETTRVEGLSSTTTCSSVIAPGSALPPGARRVTTQWHPDWRLPVRRVEAKKITSWIYNGQPDPFNGNAVSACAPGTALLPDGKPIAALCKQVEQATTDVDGNQGSSGAPRSL